MEYIHFNPRAPCGARPDCGGGIVPAMEFQSTRPLRGATFEDSYIIDKESISIHAPLAGRDTHSSELGTHGFYFNPRAPCGARPSVTASDNGKVLFQSTRPLRGATRRAERSNASSVISIHAPLAGRDQSCLISAPPCPRFQSTRPLRGATAALVWSGCP